MKKILSLLLAVTFVVGAFCVPASAIYADKASTAYIQYGTTAHDLGAYGLHAFRATPVSVAPALDGAIATGEYGTAASDIATLGNGLTLTNSTGTTDYTEECGEAYKNFKLTTYLVYDANYLYIAEQVEGDIAIEYIDPTGAQSTISTHVRYGMNQSKLVPEAASRLSNSYVYRFDTATNQFQVGACTAGNRSYKKISGLVSESKTLAETVNADTYSDWSLEKYGQNTAIGYTENNGVHTYVFEYKIPLGDASFSIAGNYNASKVKELLKEKTFYGSYLFQVSLTRTGGTDGDKQVFLSTGYAGDRAIYPFSNPNGTPSTWSREVRTYWTNSKGESLATTYIPSPVVHGASAGSSGVGSTSGFRPGLTGYRLDQIATAYRLGEKATFTVVPDAIENTSPVEGDIRVVPVEFRVRKGYDTEILGTFEKDFKTGKFDTKELSVGLHTLVVTFLQQKFDGKNWVDTKTYKNLSRNFTINGTVMGAAQGGASQTGDNVQLLLIAGASMMMAAGVAGIVLKKKKVK